MPGDYWRIAEAERHREREKAQARNPILARTDFTKADLGEVATEVMPKLEDVGEEAGYYR